ncbi:MAG TPA: hypothetical protein VK466_08510 [Terriglobales bacterium]|nr:hypothetical protein [Terriglobales bacterium]
MNRLKSLWKASGIANPISSSDITGWLKSATVLLVYVLIGIPVVLFMSATCVLLVTRIINWAWAGTDLNVTNVIGIGLFGMLLVGGVQSFFDWVNR